MNENKISMFYLNLMSMKTKTMTTTMMMSVMMMMMFSNLYLAFVVDGIVRNVIVDIVNDDEIDVMMMICDCYYYDRMIRKD